MPVRLTVVLTHPVQYFAPWFRYIAAHRPELDLTVLYGAIPSAEQQGAGFGVPFAWDVPLTEGYRFEICSEAAGKRFDSESFFGLDVPDIGDRIAATRPDVVLVTGWHSAMQIRALRECRARAIPALYRGDSTVSSGPRSWLRPVWAVKTRLMLRWFDAFLSVGSDANDYLRAFGVPEPLIARSPHSVDNEWFASRAAVLRGPEARQALRADLGLAADDFVVLFAGKLQPIKRPLDAVRAVAGLGRSAVLMTAGDGELAGDLTREAEALGVRHLARGFLNQSAMPSAYAAADCLLLTSTRETWGLVVNEAMASGLPCVVSKGVSAARDLIVEATGGTFDVGDVAGATSRLEDVRARRASGHEFDRACQARIAGFSYASATEGLVTASGRVLARRRVAIDKNPGHPRIVMCGGGMVKVFGLERSIFEMMRVVREAGGAVHGIVNEHESSSIVAHLDAVGASWSTGYYRHAPKRRLRSPGHALLIVWDAIRTSAGLLRDVARFRATHVVLSDFGMALRNFPALLLLRAARIRVVHKVGNAPDLGSFYRRMWRWLINPVVDVFVANSQFTAAELADAGVAVRKVRVVYNTAPFREPAGPSPVVKDPHRIIYVGQIIPPKGLSLLLDAVAAVRARDARVTLDIVGDIEAWEPPSWTGYRESLRTRAAEPDLRGAVRFLGVRDDVPELLAAAAVHCCPSLPEIREAFGIVNIEAKLAGIPSVVLPTGALPELITHRYDGWVCREATAEALTEGLDYFLANADRRMESGRHARTSFDRFRREAFAERWFDALGVTASHRPPTTNHQPVDRHAH